MRFVVLACVALLAGCAGNAGETLVRGTPPLDRSPAAALSADDFAAGTFTASDGTTLPYRLLAPARIEPGRRYPLVVQFHGSGAIGNDNRAQIERDFAARAWAIPTIRARHPAFVLVPQFPVRSANYDDPVAPRSAIAAPGQGRAMISSRISRRRRFRIMAQSVNITRYYFRSGRSWLESQSGGERQQSLSEKAGSPSSSAAKRRTSAGPSP